MNRIEKRLAELKEKKEKAFITYITAGLPDMNGMKEILKAEEAAGADIIELGIPFSDPVADGPVIQAASYKAIQNGVTLKKVFTAVQEMREEGLEIPLVFMMYSNTIFHYGVKEFVEMCKKTGVDGLIVPDLPLEEQEPLKEQLGGCDETVLIQLVAPVSKDRVPMILKDARGFVYCVSSMGVTGQAGSFHKEIINYLSEVKSISKIPVMMGFGIRTAEDVRPMKDVIDGAIVGTHFINLMEESGYSPKIAAEYCRTFKEDLNRMQ